LNSKLQDENNHFMYLERINIEYKTYEPRLRDLESKEEQVRVVMEDNKRFQEQSKEDKGVIGQLREDLARVGLELEQLLQSSKEKQDTLTDLEARLQQTNFEKHRLKDVIQGDDEFYSIRNIVDKIH
jgi:chromosome segregation ATPase